MNMSICMKNIGSAIEYARDISHITNYNWRETLKSRTIVAFGLGKFFEDTHKRLFSMLDVAYLCDNNESLWGGINSERKFFHRPNWKLLRTYL